jgi:N-acetylmuramoyl-L-alanine amidase
MTEGMMLGEWILHGGRVCATASLLCIQIIVGLPLSFFSPLHAQQQTLKLSTASDTSRSVTISAVQRSGVLYASIEEVSRSLSLTVTRNPTDNSTTINRPKRQAIFFPESPFVALAGHAGKRTSLQLPQSIISISGTLYLPVGSCASVFDTLFGITATFDPSSTTLRIGKPAPPKPTFDVSSLVLEQKANGVFIRIPSQRLLSDAEGLLQQDGWLYVTIPNAKADIAALNKIKPTGAIKRIVASQFRTSAQIAFLLHGKFVSSEIVKDDATNDLLINVRAAFDEALDERRIAGMRKGLDQQRKKYELDVIVLDAGHGGRDPGTIGVTGTREKNIALNIVLKIGKLIKRHLKGVKVVYTRDDDTFVELDRRGQIANEKNGKLFISIHCNAMPRKPHPARGFEVYLLRPGRTDEAIEIAERENSVIELEEGYERRYQKLTDENFILVTMAQSAHMRASELFAEIATREMGKVLNTQDNGVKQAGFLVLVGSAMPNVLIETAYLSNREDERLLKSESGQDKYADAIFNAIKRYKTEYEKLLQEGKDFGDK